MSYLIFLLLLLFTMTIGYFSGLFPVLINVVGTLLGYLTLFFYAKPLGDFLTHKNIGSGLVPYVASAFFLLFSILLFFTFFSFLLKRYCKKKEIKFSQKYWISGAILNGVIGIVLALFVIWGVLFLQAQSANPPKDFAPNWIERISGSFTASIVHLVLNVVFPDSPDLVGLATHLAENPVQGLNTFQSAVQMPEMAQIFHNPQAQQWMQEGKVEDLIQEKSFEELFQNPEFLEKLKKLGLANTEEGLEATKKQLGTVMTKAWKKIGEVQDNKRFNQILRDPHFQEVLERKNVLELMSNPQMKELVEILLQTPTPEK